MKILTTIGARPQFIKAAVISRELRKCADIDEIIVHTGQHYDDSMSDIFFRELEIPTPQYHLGIGSGNHGAQTGRMLEALEKVMLETRPDKVLIYGDTNSTLAGALAAAKLHIPVAHVEAGLRSFNRKMPEEINRVTADHLSTWLFAPTETAVANLRHEGIADSMISLSGDVMYDAAIYFGGKNGGHLLEERALQPKEYVLATIHRAENTDSPANLRCLFNALNAVADEVPVVLPLHPRTRAALKRENLLDGINDHLHVLDPVGYLDMVALEKSARLVVTDSGGVQKEAFFHRVPCVTLRHETEWSELVDLGWNVLVPPTSAKEVEAGVMQSLQPRTRKPIPDNLYGGGKAGEHITQILRAA
jgi:UDP-GlcNAc3NAcA epimerase